MRFMKLIIVLSLLCLFVGAAFGQATIRNVGVGKPYATIQAAINAADNGDVVIVFDGTYAENVDLIGKTIGVRVDISSAATVDGGNVGSCFTVSPGSESGTYIKGFTIYNGNGTTVEYESHIYRVGGGIYVNDSTVEISGNTFYDCEVYATGMWGAYGGGIYAGDMFDEAKIPYNPWGPMNDGRVRATYVVNIEDNTFTECAAHSDGSAIMIMGIEDTWQANIKCNYIDDCGTATTALISLDGDAGWESSRTIGASTIIRNTLIGDRDWDPAFVCWGIYLNHTQTIKCAGNLIVGMTIGVEAHNVYYLNWVNDTITECGLYCTLLMASTTDMTVDMYNCINWDNNDMVMINVYLAGMNDYTLTARFGSNCFDGGWESIYDYGDDVDITYERTNFEDNPDFLYKYENGPPGYWWTDYHLDVTPGHPSLCIDVGDNDEVETDYDMDGEARIRNGDVDVGADETDPPTKY